MIELICISCPVGCMMQADISDMDDIKITGNSCNIGIKYGVKELTNPRRIVTTSVLLEDGDTKKMISVKTQGDVPKDKIFEVLQEIKKLKINKADVQIGNVLIKDILGFGADVVVTRGLS